MKSETLAAKHYKNRFIRENQCYTCHSDYGVAGTARQDGIIPSLMRDEVACLTCHTPVHPDPATRASR